MHQFAQETISKIVMVLRTLLHSLIILALATAGISPACAFISGGMTQIEICGADGSLKTISVSADQAPEGSSHHKADQSQECAFCFNAAHSHGFLTAPVIEPILQAGYLKISAGSALPLSYAHTAFRATGPPSFSS